MSLNHNTENGSFRSLSNDIEDIYRTYAVHNGSEESLGSENNESAVITTAQVARPSYTHLLSHLSSLQVLDDPSRSSPGTPVSSNSFDFSAQPHGVTNSSLNVLLTTPSTELQYRELVSTPPVFNISRLRKDESDEVLDMEENDEDEQDENEDDDDDDDNDNAIDDSEDAKDDGWAERGAASKTVGTDYDYKVIKRTVKDFKFGKDLGEGSYSTVVLATDKLTGKQYAVKILDKRHIIKEKKVKYVNIEKHALNRLNNRPGIISLFFTFQDKYSLYFVLDYASNGELLTLIKKYGTLSEDCTRHFGAQILDAIKHMHNNGVIHRDIKPENILLDSKFRIQITDFGTAKLLEKKNHGEPGEDVDYPVDVRARSFVGTAEYVSPELLESKYCGKPGDIWAFGCILYQMVAGKPPFKATNEYLTFQKITKLQYAFSAGFPLILRDLIKQVLVLQPSRRATIDQIEQHHFFEGIDFKDESRIWASELPELGPYKMTAKSMMKVPVMSKSASQQTIVRKAAKKPEPKRVASDGVPINGTKGFSPASVAAFVLNKQDDTETESDSTSQRPSQSSTSNGSRTPATPDYIPGTNILRPVIHTMASFSRSTPPLSSLKNDDASRKPKSRVMEVTPLSSVELAWQKYLTHASERIIHVGLAIVCKQPTEYFERKHRGLIHNAPLGFTNKLQAAANHNNGRSMLSQVVQGNKGLRGVPDYEAPTHGGNEEDAITFFSYDEPESKISSIPEHGENATPNSTNSTSKLGKALFKKLLSHNDKKGDHASDTLSMKSSGSGGSGRRQSFSLDKARTCTVLVTTFGRLLVFLRDDRNSDYTLITEVKLNFPFILIKEVVSNHGTKFSKMIPVTGIFAVESEHTTLVFEVEKYEVDHWTEALAKAKLNQFEREREEELKLRPVSRPSPKLMDSPQFANPSVTQARRNGKRESSPSASPSSPATPQPRRAQLPVPVNQSLDPREKVLAQHLLFQNKLRSSKSVKRKPPPPLPRSVSLSTGLARDSVTGESGMVHAAQLAVSNNAHVTMTENQRNSSFSRDNGSSPPIVQYKTSSGSGKQVVTSMNSKFLARTRGKK